MRLTLRTLLAYLDDTLEPAQAKLIGQKIAESEQARDIIALIQQVTRRRRITTPPDSGPGGKLDPNTLGEYLDNVISPEQAAEVEEICLASDTHLAEIAACHQILSLLGEPTLVPPSSSQRMYGLVKGPEAVPFRKPPPVAALHEHAVPESRDIDDTLRMGLAPVTGKNRGNPWVLIVAGLAAACLLVVAVWQILQERERPTIEPAANNNQVAQADPNQDKPTPPVEPKDKAEVKKEVTPVPMVEKPLIEKDLPEVKLTPAIADIPWAPPSAVVREVGKLLNDAKDPAILLHSVGDKMEWHRLGAKNPAVTTGRALVSLPAARSVIALDKGLTLMLVGSMTPELFGSFPLYESRVELHAHPQLDLDMTLHRGRIRVACGAQAARIRVRFDNPTQPSQHEYFDIVLQLPGAEVLIDRWSLPPSEKFFRDPKDVNRVGPSAHMNCVVLAGSILIRSGDVSQALTAPPGLASVYWNSVKGLERPLKLDALPDGLTNLQPLPPGFEPRLRTDILKARDELHQQLLTKPVDVALAEGLKSMDPALRRLSCCCLGAVDDISGVLEQLEQESAPKLRLTAIDVLRNWQACDRDNDYKLFELLKEKYRPAEADSIVTLLHYFSAKEVMNPDTYDLLINYLDHPRLALRELGAWWLYTLVPAGHKIAYIASADAATRRQGQAAWRALIPAGQLPPMMKGKQEP